MKTLETLVHDAYTPLLVLPSDLYASDMETGQLKFFRRMLDELPGTIADKETLMQIEIAELFDSMNHTATLTGAATLWRSLLQPFTSIDLIHAKQDSLQELKSNERLREALQNYVGEFKSVEKLVFDFLNERFFDWPDPTIYMDLKKARKAMAMVYKSHLAIPKPESEYLGILLSDVGRFGETSLYSMISKKIYRTSGGIIPKEEVNFWSKAVEFHPRHINGFSAATLATPFFSTFFRSHGLLSETALDLYAAAAILGAVVGGLYGIAKWPLDYLTAVNPLREQALSDPNFQLAIDSVGKLDELLSFLAYSKAMPHRMERPNVHESDSHYFRANDMVNPILGKNDALYVPNDVELNGGITFVMGKNSIGKTTLAKTIAQIQTMAQIGSDVPGYVELSVADRLFYQYYLADKLNHPEGDFGVNLERTRDIFYRTTPRSLVILNVLAPGTEHAEETDMAYGILNDFGRTGSNTLYITHNKDLAQRFWQEGRGQFLTNGFDGNGSPTRKFVHGISQDSGSEEVARRIGFSPADRQTYLRKMGK